MVRGQPDAACFLSTLANLHCQNITIDLNKLTNYNNDCKVLPDAPTYCWDHSFSKLYMPRENKEWLWCEHPRHELLGIRVIDSTATEPSWRNVLHVEHVPWLRDHQLGGVILFPAAAYITMVCAALTQLNGEQHGYRLQDIVLKNAMALQVSGSTEIITALRQHPGGSWYDFSISSHNGTVWTQHCYGRARLDDDLNSQQVPGNKAEFPRSVNLPAWFQTLRGVGLDFGPSFQCLDGVSSSANNHAATAKIISKVNDGSYYYPIHPTELDAIFQTALVAIHQGLDWTVQHPHIPITIGDLYISQGGAELESQTWVTGYNGDDISADAEAFDKNGIIHVKLKDAILHPMKNDDAAISEQDSRSVAQLVWKPHIRFQKLSELISTPKFWNRNTQLLQSLTSICIDQALVKLQEQGVSSNVKHMAKYQAWLRKQPIKSSSEDHKQLVSELLRTPTAPWAKAMMMVLDNIVPLCKGELEPLELLMSDDTLLKTYNYLNLVDRSQLFTLLGHQLPNQRILEIGAGTGGTTSKILQDAKYSTYTFSDISAAFFPAARERFKLFSNIEFKTLDISMDPLGQGFEPGSYDLIVAANVLHATPSLHQTLRNVRKLLHPDGKLLLEEIASDTKATNFVVGILPGWWEGEADGRVDEPYVSPDRWEQELKEAGFNGIDDYAFDSAAPNHINSYILASPLRTQELNDKTVCLVTDTSSQQSSVAFKQAFQSKGYRIILQGLKDPIPKDICVVVLVDTEVPFFSSLESDKLSAF